jgi:hypothetical protein
MNRPALAIVVALAYSAPAAAGPRDDLLRVAPPDAALVVVVQNARSHVQQLLTSPFAEWFPSTEIGKKLLGSEQAKQLRAAAGVVLPAIGTTPQALLEDVFGDAVAFAYSPAPPDKPGDERAVILIRPRKPETLAKIIETLNAIQTQQGEVKVVTRRLHMGAEYFERQKPNGGGEFYCLRDGVFAFSSSEADIKAVIGRQRAPAKDGPPELVARMQQLGVQDAVAVVLVNPRPLDAEVRAKVAAANPESRRFLGRFAEVWAGLESAAFYASLDAELEIGVALRFHPDKLPADLKPWLVGPRGGNAAEALIPKDALLGVAGHVRASELLDLIASVAPTPPDKPGVREWVAQALGPIVGRDNLPVVLNSLGPNWAAWAEPPAEGAFLPTLVAAVELTGDAEARAKAEKALTEAVRFGFQTARIAYNHHHADQVELVEEKDAASGVTVTSLVNDKGFPPGFRPSFGLTRGYLVLATNPESIRRFRPPAPGATQAKGQATLARFSGAQSRDYLRTHGDRLSGFLAGAGVGDEKSLRQHIEGLAAVLELVDSAELVARDVESGVKLSVKVKAAKPLK